MHPRGYVCFRAPHALTLNGKLDDPAWAHAPWSQDFDDIEGDLKPHPQHRTRMKMMWDDNYFYIGAELIEPHVWGTLTRHDSVIFQDNDFEVFLDPDGDNHNYYELEINALNTTWDLRLPKAYRDGGPALNEWEIPGMKTAVSVQGTLNDSSDLDHSWTVEIALPWKPLGEYATCASPPHPGDAWRINFSRVEWDTDIIDGKYVKVPNRPEHNWVWAPQGIVDMHQPETWGYVQFSADPSHTEKFHPDPTHEARMELFRLYKEFKALYARHECYDVNQVKLMSGFTFKRTATGYALEVTVGHTHLRMTQDSQVIATKF